MARRNKKSISNLRLAALGMTRHAGSVESALKSRAMQAGIAEPDVIEMLKSMLISEYSELENIPMGTVVKDRKIRSDEPHLFLKIEEEDKWISTVTGKVYLSSEINLPVEIVRWYPI